MRHRLVLHGAVAAGVLVVVVAAVAVPWAASNGGTPGRGAPATTTTPTHATSSGSATSSAPATTSGAHLPAAPKGFAAQLGGIYGQIHAAITTLGVPTTGAGAVGGLPTQAGFAKLVGRLSAKDLSVLYAGTTKNSGWPSLGHTLQQLDLDAVAHPGAAASAFSAGSATSSKPAATPATSTPAGSASPANTAHTETPAPNTGGSSTFPPTSPTGPFPQPPAAYTPAAPVGPTDVEPPTCPQLAPGPDWGAAATYSAQVSADIINETIAGLPSTLGVIVDGTPATFPDPARIALTVVADADNILLDTVSYMDNAWNDCGVDQVDQISANVDNTTVATFELTTLLESTLDDVESSVDTISGQVHVVQQSMDDQLTLTIEQDLAAPANSTPNLALELPASVGGNLDSTPIGVQAIVTDAVQGIGAAGEALNPAASQYLAAADAAVTAGNDVQAYDDFHTAYLEAVQ